jgi:cobalt-zinc-cadmium resistance protein CzcA
MRTSEMLSGVRGDLAVKIYGPDPAVLDQLSEQVSKLLNGVDGAQDVMRTQNEGVQYLQVEIDRIRAGRLVIG